MRLYPSFARLKICSQLLRQELEPAMKILKCLHSASFKSGFSEDSGCAKQVLDFHYLHVEHA